MSADEGGDTTSMPLTNGEPNPSPADSVAVTTPGKRKRRSSQEEKAAESSNSSATHDKTNLHETLRSLVELLLK